jgi:hypothetical protein
MMRCRREIIRNQQGIITPSILQEAHDITFFSWHFWKRTRKKRRRIQFVSSQADMEESLFFIRSVTTACGCNKALGHALRRTFYPDDGYKFAWKFTESGHFFPRISSKIVICITSWHSGEDENSLGFGPVIRSNRQNGFAGAIDKTKALIALVDSRFQSELEDLALRTHSMRTARPRRPSMPEGPWPAGEGYE